MTEQMTTAQTYYTKDFNDYSNTQDNFVANQELTVTITLNEYRKLVGSSAVTEKRISEANSEKYKAQREIEKLNKENSELKAKVYELQNPELSLDEEE
jgi:cell division protein FtsB